MRCPNCSGLIFPTDTRCPHCRQDFDQSAYQRDKAEARSFFAPLGALAGTAAAAEAATKVRLSLRCLPMLNLLLAHAGIPAVEPLEVENTGDTVVADLYLHAAMEPPVLIDVKERLGQLAPGKRLPRERLHLPPDYPRFLAVGEKVDGVLKLRALDGDRVVAEAQERVEVQAANEWIGVGAAAVAIVGMVTPNDPAVLTFFQALGRSFAGYQGGGGAPVLGQLEAIFGAIAGGGFEYLNVPVSYEPTGQKVLFPAEVLRQRKGACLDYSVLLAALLERAGLRPLLVFVEGHAMIGAWLTPPEQAGLTIQSPILQDRRELEGLLAEGLVGVYNSTSFFGRRDWSLDKAQQDALPYLQRFNFCLDVAAARPGRDGRPGITPINVTR